MLSSYSPQVGKMPTCRNLTDEQRTYTIGKMYEARKNTQGGDRRSEEFSSAQSEHLKRASEQIATEIGVGKETVKRSEKFAKGVDALREVSPEAADKVLSGKANVTKKDVQSISKMPPKAVESAAKAIVKGKPIVGTEKNLTDEQRTYTIGKMYEARKKSVGNTTTARNADGTFQSGQNDRQQTRTEIKQGTTRGRAANPATQTTDGGHGIMETDSKNKRGRPSIYQKLFGNDTSMREAIESFESLESERSKTNKLYYLEGMGIMQRHIGEDAFREIFHTPKGNARRSCIVEQIGRMSLQNNYDEDSCNLIADKAIAYLKGGYTVREIESWIRQGRNSNEW